MKYILLLIALSMALFGCLDFLRYSESTYVHTVGITEGSSRICYIEVEEPLTFTYELSSAVPVDLVIAKGTGCSFNQTTGEPIIEENSVMTKAFGISDYSESIGLGMGTYILAVYSEQSCSSTKITTNLAMDCV